jgi:hypothetical protein
MADNELWSFANALAFLILLVCIILACLFGFSTIVNITHIKADWANQRCNPMIMPFASYFDHDTSENFNFCMGKIFNSHAGSYMGSFTSIFSKFTGLLSGIFNSINSLRNVIASLGGGINVIFQEFTDRITMFFFTLRVNAMRLKMMFGRLYAILFSIMYMGMSGITGMTSFTNTFLFSFLDTFCFPGDTLLSVKANDTVKQIPIKEVKIGDILVPGNTRVTATFSFYAKGQPMVKLGSTIVSTNHYVMYQGKAIKSGDHPHAIHLGGWDSDEHLYCLNTSSHIIPVGLLEFIDYDETSEGDKETMQYVEDRINATQSNKIYHFKEYGFGLTEDQKIITTSGLKAMRDICIGDKLSTGSEVVGIIRKEVGEICKVLDVYVTPSTLYWDTKKWVRFGERFPIENVQMECISLVVAPNSQIQLENGLYVRDYMELCSPDTEIHYTKHLLSCNIK